MTVTTLTLDELVRLARDTNPPLAALLDQIVGIRGGQVLRVDLRLLNLTTA